MSRVPASEVMEAVRAGRTVPSSWYTDPAVFQLEQERIFRTSWHYVTDTGSLPEVGSQVRWEIGGVPIVVERGGDGEIRGFVALGLVPIQVHVWGPMVWANVSLDAPAFDDDADGLAALLAARGCRVEEQELAFGHEWIVDCNWKVLLDNTIECYHCPTTHPELSRALVMDPDQQEIAVGGARWIYHVIPFRDGVRDGVTLQRDEHGELTYFFTYLFPSAYVQYTGKGFDVGSVQAIAVDRVRWRHLAFLSPDTPAEARAGGQRALERDPTINQDVAICTRVQAAHETGLAPPGRLLPQSEHLLTRFYELIVASVGD